MCTCICPCVSKQHPISLLLVTEDHWKIDLHIFHHHVPISHLQQCPLQSIHFHYHCIESCQWFPKVFKIWQWGFGMTKGTFSYLGFFFFPPSKFGTFVFWEGPGTSCSTEGWKQWLMRRNGYKRECDSLRLLIPSSRRVFVSRQIK